MSASLRLDLITAIEGLDDQFNLELSVDITEFSDVGLVNLYKGLCVLCGVEDD